MADKVVAVLLSNEAFEGHPKIESAHRVSEAAFRAIQERQRSEWQLRQALNNWCILADLCFLFVALGLVFYATYTKSGLWQSLKPYQWPGILLAVPLTVHFAIAVHRLRMGQEKYPWRRAGWSFVLEMLEAFAELARSGEAGTYCDLNGVLERKARIVSTAVFYRYLYQYEKSTFRSRQASEPGFAHYVSELLHRSPVSGGVLDQLTEIRKDEGASDAGQRQTQAREDSAQARFEARASWLNKRRLERGWGTSDPYEHGGPDRKGDASLLADKQAVSFRTAEQYLNEAPLVRGGVNSAMSAGADEKSSDEPARVEQATVDGVVASGSSKSEQAGGAVPATDEARPAQPSPATVMNIGNATDRRGAEIILDSAPLSLADRAEIEQQLDQWRDGISVDIALLLGWSGRLEVTIPPKSMEYFRELQPDLRNRSFLRLAFDWEGSGSEILSHDQITATLLKNLQKALKRYARRAIGLISSKWANTGIHPNAFAARMELAAEALEDDINQRLKDGVSALAHGASTDSLEIALWEEVKTGIARKIDLYRRNAQLVGLCELPQRDDVVPECRATKESASPLPEGGSTPPLPAREQTDTAGADSRGSHEPAQPQPVTVSDLSEPNPTLHPIRPEDAYAGIIQLGTVSHRKERVVPRSEYQAWLQKLKSLALLGAKYRRRSVVPNVSALQKLHVDAMDLLLGIGPPVSGIREELEDLKLALYISQRYDWRVYPDKIRRFTKLLIAAHRLLERDQRVSCVAATDRAETFPPAAVEKTVGPTGDAVIVASVGHAVGEGRHRVSHWEGTVIQEIASGLSEAGDRKKTDRIAQVEAFVSRCRQEKGVKVMKKHIWLAVGHKKARQFQYWQAGQNRLPGETRGATQRDDENFRRILAMTPLDFKALLKKMGIA